MKTSELNSVALDWAVAKCEGIDFWKEPDGLYLNEGGEVGCLYAPSTTWAQGGPIIEREKIEIRESCGKWIAMWWADNSGMAKNPAQRFEFNRVAHGPTPLVAAMRAYVASKLGGEIDVPADLKE